ncbi:MAG TPA: thiamine pyrophosphate-dependent dehydrogenase E1 component subunit alpha [Syntrophorhabdales bacterium]|nr:thiamine pyrophosphate-dependent dehydrogenase E1 component subunit alpha [Syntrophorhabdales bacterium]
MSITREELISMYTKMLTIRRFEERAVREWASGAIPGLIHSYIGQEAVAVGVCAHLGVDDRIVSNHRGHGHCIAKGADLKRMMAEIYGKKTGYCKGKGGSMHIADFSIGMLGANGIVCAGLPIAVGAALAAQLESKDRVTVVFFGDGASNEGAFHESLNLASIWKLPIIFACENNLYGANTLIWDVVRLSSVAERARAYAIPGRVVDGNDVVEVYEAAQEAVVAARSGEGPHFLEFRTYRWRHHFEGGYFPDLRPKDEVEAWKERCPIKRFEQKLLTNGVLDRAGQEAINLQVMSRVEDAVGFAIESPFPDPEDALKGVYSE